jgi:hypothetical protein
LLGEFIHLLLLGSPTEIAASPRDKAKWISTLTEQAAPFKRDDEWLAL